MIQLRALLFSLTLAFWLTTCATGTVAQVAVKPAPGTPVDVNASSTQTLIDSSVADDPAVTQMLEAYTPRVRSLNQVIGKLRGDLRKGGVGAGTVGNFVTDGMRAEAELKLRKPVALAVTNSGGLRKNIISEGDLRLQDIFELLPFENALVAFELTGAQVIELLRGVVDRRDAQSGARIKYGLDEQKRPRLKSVKLLIRGRERVINPAAAYTVVTTDYLIRVTGGDYASVFSRAKHIRPIGVTMRDALTRYVRAQTANGRQIKATFDGRFVFDNPEGATSEETP